MIPDIFRKEKKKENQTDIFRKEKKIRLHPRGDKRSDRGKWKI